MSGSLDLVVRRQFGELTLDVELTGLTGVTALVGPNGAGKTSVLRAAAGLAPAQQVVLDGERLERRPAHRRRFALVLGEPLLRPRARVRREVALVSDRARARAALAAVGASEFAERRVETLSSGEAGRVALARALACDPRALLLDEPLARLDAQARPEVRSALRGALAAVDGPVLLVSHDVVDVAALASRVVVLEHGVVTHDCAPAKLTARPRTAWAAAFAGLEVLRGAATDGRVVLEAGGELTVPGAPQGPVLVALRASGVTLSAERPDSSARNAWPAVVIGVEQLPGGRARVRLAGPPDVVAEVTAKTVSELGLDVGSAGWASVKATDLEAYPA